MDASLETATSFKYRAFISYSHRDRKRAEWLHKAIERYRVPKPLVGQPGRDGPIPKQISRFSVTATSSPPRPT